MSLHLTQFPNIQKKENHTLVIGLDFGTSSSKVVINNINANVFFAINFGSLGHPDNRFLLPTIPYFDKTGKLCLSKNYEELPLRELKKALMDESYTGLEFIAEKEKEASPQLLSIAYLAKVLRLTRNWFFDNKKKSFGHVQIDWQLNLGIPSIGEEFDNKKQLFKKIAICSWWLSTQASNICLDGARKSLELFEAHTLTLKDIHEDNINIIPEVVAEVVGYARSNQRNKGLHLLIDVGAGTLDIASFILGTDQGGDKYSVLTGDIQWYGAFELHKNRIQNIKKAVAEWLDTFGKHGDPITSVPSSVDDYLPKIKNGQSIDSDFFKSCKLAIQKTLFYIRKRRDPNSPNWNSGIPTFICGGGSHISFYSEVMHEVSSKWKNQNTNGLKILKLPKPSNLEAPNPKHLEFHRLAVAYGLSFPEYDIGIIYPPQEIEDITTLKRKIYEHNYIDKDQV